MKYRLIFLMWGLISIYSINSCNRQTEQEMADNKVFVTLRKLGLTDRQLDTRYIFFFSEGCSGCRSRMLSSILEYKLQNKYPIVITPDNLKFIDEGVTANFIVDSFNVFSASDPRFITDGVIELDNGKILRVVNINTGNTEAIISEIIRP